MPLGITVLDYGKPRHKCQYCGEKFRSAQLWRQHEKKCIKKDDTSKNIL